MNVEGLNVRSMQGDKVYLDMFSELKKENASVLVQNEIPENITKQESTDKTKEFFLNPYNCIFCDRRRQV